MFEQGDDLNQDNPPTPVEKDSESSNRTFLIVAAVMAGVLLLSLICMAVYAFFISPNRKASTAATKMAVETQNAQVAVAMTQTSVALQAPPTTLASPVVAASQTPVVAMASSTAAPDLSPAQTETMAALNTQVAVAQLTPTSTLVAAMPATGFADSIGLPGLIILSVVLVVIIFLVRRLRRLPA